MISDETFPKKEHIIKTGEFRKVYKEGAAFKRREITLYRMPNGKETNRLGIVVSSRILNRAYRRNRVKRLFRESYRRSKGMLRKGFDLIIVIRRDLGKKIDYTSIYTLFIAAARESGLLNKESPQ
jgi:ribonuclease P protein component